MRVLFSVLGCLALIALAIPTAGAQSVGVGIAAALPVELTEVTSGGSWIDGTASGTYRVFVVIGGIPDEGAEVHIQWIGSRTPASPLQIIASMPIKEFNTLRLPSATISVDAEVDGEARVSIAGPETPGETPVVMSILAGLPGQYTRMPQTPVSGGQQPVQK
jgi:hypothetical protein